MADAVAALGTSDFEELGVGDGGAELRAAVEDLVTQRAAAGRQRQGGGGGGGSGGGSSGSGSEAEGAPGRTGLPRLKVGGWRRPPPAAGGAQ